MTEVDARIQQLQVNIRQAEQDLADHLNLWSDWRVRQKNGKDDPTSPLVFTPDNQEDSPLVIELRAKIASWRKELAPLLSPEPKGKPGRRKTDPRYIKKAIELKESGKPDKEIAAIMELEFHREFTPKQIGHYFQKINSPK